ncbi:MAG: YifB family Mg chelatase-like AAA ATPase [Hyphomicrobiaceae bacterium]
MFGQIGTVAFVGVEARPVSVQVQVSSGMRAFAIVGLPDKAVAESRERVHSALHAMGLGLPGGKHVTVNLAPADLPKEGSHYDLPIALALMVSLRVLTQDQVEGYLAIGELALDGSIAPIVGALPAAIGANAAGKGLICPQSSGQEAAWASPDMEILAPPHLLSLINHFKGLQSLRRPEPAISEDGDPLPDLKDVKGQETAKRALEIAAAGGHNMLMIGPPGAGKTMLAARLPSILPPMTPAEMLEVSQIQSLAGELMEGKLSRRRPFRAPHHSASMAAMVGGGTRPRPGEVSLAHRGVLFLDELPEFTPQVLDSLRQPLEAGETVIARANHRITYPSRIQLVAAMNPCRCGKALDPGYTCSRGRACAEQYQSRLSGPFLDRIDIQIEVPAVTAADLALPQPAEDSATVRERVVAARERQRQRFESRGLKNLRSNAECQGALLEEIAQPDEAGARLLREAAGAMGLTARGYHRTLRVARTLADLDGQDIVSHAHVAEALSYRGETLRKKQAA